MDTQDRWEQGALMGVLTFFVLLAVALQTRGDELHDRAAAAIAIHTATEVNPWFPPVPKTDVPPPPIADKPKADAKPIVTMYSATWCGPCQRAKAELKAAKLPFELKIVDVSNGGQPGWCGSLPGFGWEVKGQTRYVLGYSGMSSLVKSWEATQKPAKQMAAANNYNPRWTWPGNLMDHLRTTHGVTDSLTQDQAEAVHDALHEGYSASQIRAYAKRHGYIK